jgi:hypothetical protein
MEVIDHLISLQADYSVHQSDRLETTKQLSELAL